MKRGKAHAASDLAYGAGAIAIASAAGADQPPRTIQLLAIGSNPSRNGKPPVVTVRDRAHADRVATATAAYHRGNQIVVDYDHQSMFGARPGVGGQARASGWMPRVYATDEGVFADVEWTEAAASAIVAHEYRYISPVFTHDKAGNVLCIINAALTNTPSLDLAAVASALSTDSTGEDDMNMANILKALGLGEDATEEEVLRAIANANGAAAMTAIATALGAADGADLVAAASALKEKAEKVGDPDPAKFVPVETVAALATSVQSLQGTVDSLQAKDRAGKIADAQKSGRLPPALVTHATALNDEQLDSFLGALPEGGLGKASVEGDPARSTSGKLDAAELAVASAFGMTEDEFIAERDGEQKGAN